MSTLDKAIKIATEAHAGDEDKIGVPYIEHPMRVMAKVDSEDEKTAAVLHDVVEDTDWTIEKLREEGFSETVLEAVACLTKPKDKDEYAYAGYLRKIRENPIALKVKLADISDNTDPERTRKLKPEDREKLAAKYEKALKMLTREEIPLIFKCAKCGAEAGRITAIPDEKRLVVEGIICDFSTQPDSERFPKQLEQVRSGDTEAFLGEDGGWTQSYCRHCEKFYCRKHWDTGVVYDDGFYDYTEGTCPEGHRIKLDD
ncbi:MAG: HD domain-containing protein [Kiritimatiellia bacterium]|jgi:hypothetical protein|nr:HD domain-containing protein [Kiritimatiellia bacterium]